MGTDIHAYPELAYVRDQPIEWHSVCGSFFLERDYDLFGKIAGVRGGTALFPVRGLPPNIAIEACDDYFDHVVQEPWKGSHSHVSYEQAARMVAQRNSVWADDRHMAASSPDWHHPTWLTTEELRQSITAPRNVDYSIGARWLALLAMLEEIERHELEARLVIWFDN